MRALVLLLSLFLAGAVGAQSQSQQVPEPSPRENVKDQQQRPATQPGNNAPFYREVRGGQSQYTTSSAQGRESGVLIATALGAFFLHERVTAWRAAGAALVVAGVALLSL